MNKVEVLSLIAILFSGCIHIQNAKVCTVAGRLSDGGICSHLLTPDTESMTFDEYLNWLEPQPEASGAPGHGGAICMSSADWGTMKDELERACRELKGECSYEAKAQIKKMRAADRLRPVSF